MKIPHALASELAKLNKNFNSIEVSEVEINFKELKKLFFNQNFYLEILGYIKSSNLTWEIAKEYKLHSNFLEDLHGEITDFIGDEVGWENIKLI